MKYIEYVVQVRDSLGKIARKHLNNAKLYPTILDQNNNPIANPDKIEIGQILHIPNLAAYKKYTVKVGDTLGGIANKLLGQTSLYVVILNEDGNVIANPDRIEVGQIVRIPLNMLVAGEILTLSALQNMTYKGVRSDVAFALKGGKFSKKINRLETVEAELVHHRFGHLTGDGKEDAAVILWSKTSGTTGRFLHLVAVVQKGDKLVERATIYIDDRPMITEFSLSRGRVTIKYVETPSGEKKVRHYRLQGSKWVSA